MLLAYSTDGIPADAAVAKVKAADAGRNAELMPQGGLAGWADEKEFNFISQ